MEELGTAPSRTRKLFSFLLDKKEGSRDSPAVNNNSKKGKKGKHKFVWLMLGGVAMLALLPGDVEASNRLDNIVTAFRAVIDQYGGYATRVGVGLAVTFAGIELMWTGARIGLLTNKGGEAIGLFTIKLLVMLIIFATVQSGVIWMDWIGGGFFTLSEGLTGNSTLSPSGTMTVGNNIAVFIAGIAPFGIFDMAESLGMMIGALIIWVAFAIVALTQAVVLIEYHLLTELAPVFLAFGLLANTAGIAEGYLSYLLKVGLKIMLLFLVVDIGHGYFVNTMWPYVQTIDEPGLIGIFGGIFAISAVLYAVIATSIPNRWGEIMSGIDWGLKSVLYETRF